MSQRTGVDLGRLWSGLELYVFPQVEDTEKLWGTTYLVD